MSNLENRVARLEAENKALKALLINNRVSGFNELVEYNLKAAAPAVKDWEIVALNHYHNGEYSILTRNKFGYFDGKSFFNCDFNYLTDKGIELGNPTQIHSVKRLSDGLIVTVEDITEQGRITSFQINQSDKMVVYFENGLRMLDFADLKVKPSFTFVTHDGVTITDPEQWVYVYEKSSYIAIYKESAKVPKLENCIYFSTEQARDEYLVLHTKCLSMNDVIGWLDDEYLADCGNYETLKSLVKSYLNK